MSSTQLTHDLPTGRSAAKFLAEKGKPTSATKQLELPFHVNYQRVTANCLSRSALFTIQKSSSLRDVYNSHPIYTIKGISILYSGETLNQYDLDVYMAVLHQFKNPNDYTNGLHTTLYSLLADLQMNYSKRDYERLRTSLDRLNKAHITVALENAETKVTYKGALISLLGVSEDLTNQNTPKALIRVSPEISQLFKPTMFSLIDWGFHKNLSPLAKYMHCFYISHSKPMPYSLDKLMKLTGTKSTSLSSFKQSLSKSLEELSPKILSSFYFKNNVLYVSRH